eukprot:g12466.t1
MVNADLSRIINSTEVQSVLRPKMERYTHGIKRNALKSKELMEELNPGSTERKAVQQKASQKGTPEAWNPSEKTGTMPMPVVLQSPLRPDLVREVHRDMAKNKRQAYAVKPKAGYDTAAESWCTGRAVARIPRAPGGGTHRAGQAAFGNQAAAGEVGRGVVYRAELQKVIDSKSIRAGQGKARNRRYVKRLGPLVIYNEDNGITRAMRNIPGVECAHVDRLNLLRLAPGGSFGRFVIFTEGAFKKLSDIYGTLKKLDSICQIGGPFGSH